MKSKKSVVLEQYPPTEEGSEMMMAAEKNINMAAHLLTSLTRNVNS